MQALLNHIGYHCYYWLLMSICRKVEAWGKEAEARMVEMPAEQQAVCHLAKSFKLNLHKPGTVALPEGISAEQVGLLEREGEGALWGC